MADVTARPCTMTLQYGAAQLGSNVTIWRHLQTEINLNQVGTRHGGRIGRA